MRNTTAEWVAATDPTPGVPGGDGPANPLNVSITVFGQYPAPFADLAALQADPVMGDLNYDNSDGVNWLEPGTHVTLGDYSKAQWEGNLWAPFSDGG